MTDQTTPAFELWRAHTAELEVRFAHEGEQLATDLQAVAVELEHAVDVDRAVELLNNRDRLARRLEALQSVRRRALAAAREAAAEAGRRDDSLRRARERLAAALAAAESSPALDARATAERDVAFLRQRVAELEDAERRDIERLAVEA